MPPKHSKWRVYRDPLLPRALHPWVAYHAGGMFKSTSYHPTWESALHHANINSRVLD